MKKLVSVVLALTLLVSCLGVCVFAEGENLPESGKYYKITLRNTGEGFSVNMSKENNAQIVVSKNWTGLSDEIWLLLGSGDGTYEIINRCSGKNLDVPGGSVDKDRTLIQYSYSEAQNQKWTFESARDGGYYIKNVNSNLYLTLQNRLAAQCEKSDDKAARQIFDVQVLFDGKDDMPKNYAIKVSGTDNVLAPAAEDNGAKLTSVKYDSSDPLQVWTIRTLDEENGIYKIKNNVTGYSMDVSGNNSNPGSSFLVYTSNGGSNQQFAFEYNAENTAFRIVPQHSKLFCTVKSDGSVVQDEEGAAGEQYFELSEIE